MKILMIELKEASKWYNGLKDAEKVSMLKSNYPWLYENGEDNFFPLTPAMIVSLHQSFK